MHGPAQVDSRTKSLGHTVEALQIAPLSPRDGPPYGSCHEAPERFAPDRFAGLEAVCIDLVLYRPQLSEAGTQVVTKPTI